MRIAQTVGKIVPFGRFLCRMIYIVAKYIIRSDVDHELLIFQECDTISRV